MAKSVLFLFFGFVLNFSLSVSCCASPLTDAIASRDLVKTNLALNSDVFVGRNEVGLAAYYGDSDVFSAVFKYASVSIGKNDCELVLLAVGYSPNIDSHSLPDGSVFGQLDVDARARLKILDAYLLGGPSIHCPQEVLHGAIKWMYELAAESPAFAAAAASKIFALLDAKGGAFLANGMLDMAAELVEYGSFSDRYNQALFLKYDYVFSLLNNEGVTRHFKNISDKKKMHFFRAVASRRNADGRARGVRIGESLLKQGVRFTAVELEELRAYEERSGGESRDVYAMLEKYHVNDKQLISDVRKEKEFVGLLKNRFVDSDWAQRIAFAIRKGVNPNRMWAWDSEDVDYRWACVPMTHYLIDLGEPDIAAAIVESYLAELTNGMTLTEGPRREINWSVKLVTREGERIGACDLNRKFFLVEEILQFGAMESGRVEEMAVYFAEKGIPIRDVDKLLIDSVERYSMKHLARSVLKRGASLEKAFAHFDKNDKYIVFLRDIGGPQGEVLYKDYVSKKAQEAVDRAKSEEVNRINQKRLEEERAARAERERKRLDGLAKKPKAIGDRVCNSYSISGFFSEYVANVEGYVERISENRIQLRIIHTNRSGHRYNGAEIYKGALIWDVAYNWYPCDN